MMFCGNCGARIPDGSSFCEQCGADLSKMQIEARTAGSVTDSPTVFADETLALTEDTDFGRTVDVSARLVDMRSHTVFNMTGDVMTIGKSSKASCRITGNSTISRVHAVIARRGNAYYLKDNGSLNGTFINGVSIASGQETMLRSGDLIRLSDEELVFEMLPR